MTQIPPLECGRPVETVVAAASLAFDFFFFFVALRAGNKWGILSPLFTTHAPLRPPPGPPTPGVSVLHCLLECLSSPLTLHPPPPASPPLGGLSLRQEVSLSAFLRCRERPVDNSGGFFPPEAFTHRPVCCNSISDATVKCSILITALYMVEKKKQKTMN